MLALAFVWEFKKNIWGGVELLKKRIFIASIVLLLFSNLFGQGLLSAVVLCVGESDHVAAEPYHFSSHHPIPDLASKFDQVDDSAILHTGLKGTSHGSCFDIPVSATFSAQHISTDPQSSYEAKTIISRASTGFFNPALHGSRQTLPSNNVSPGTSALTCLQTIIVLV